MARRRAFRERVGGEPAPSADRAAKLDTGCLERHRIKVGQVVSDIPDDHGLMMGPGAGVESERHLSVIEPGTGHRRLFTVLRGFLGSPGF